MCNNKEISYTHQDGIYLIKNPKTVIIWNIIII